MLSASDLAAGCTVTSECLAVLIRDGVPPPPQASPPGSPLLTPWQQLGEKVDIVKVAGVSMVVWVHTPLLVRIERGETAPSL